ncbi:MAG: NfeD family protein, partial [Phycisphaerae bacterium]
ISGGQASAIDPGLMSKFTSPLLEELRDSAQKNHYPYLMLEAMVIREFEVWAFRNNQDLNAPPVYVSGTEKDAKLKALNRLPDGSQGNNWVLDPKPIDSANSLLTVTANEAVEYGLARAEVGSDAQLRAIYNIRGDVIPMDYTWSENAVRWLSNDYVRMGLFITMLVLAYLEFSHPGVSIPGIGAVVCLILLVAAPYMTGLAQVWEIILIALGASIIIVDLLLYGGVGLLAVPGFILMAIGLVASFIPADPGGGFIPQTAQWYTGLQHGLSAIIFGSLLALAIFYFLSRYLYLTPGFRRLQLAPAVPAPPPSTSAVQDATDRSAGEAVFVGALGQAVSDLRPAGKVRFDGHLIDAVSQGQFIPEGTTVIVIEATAYHVLVKPAPTP